MDKPTTTRPRAQRIPWRLIALCSLTILLVSFLLPITPKDVWAGISTMASGDRAMSLARAPNATAYYFLPFIQGGIGGTLKPKITHIVVTLPQLLEANIGSFCTWGGCAIGPRLYHEPLANGNTLVGWTDASGNGHVCIINNNSITQTYNFSAQYVRGLTAHSDGKFAILLWDPSSKIMWLSKRNADGSEIWKTSIDDPLTSYNGGWVGDSRLTYGNGLYAAYFGVHGDSGWVQGHEGDQFTYINDSGVIQSGGWQWGCSHSLAEPVNYHPGLNKFVPVCASDCYASKGILLNDSQSVYAGDGNCGGSTSSQLGQIAHSDTTWKLVFNALNRPGYTGRGVGLATINNAFASSYVWLTNTAGDYERDPTIARLGTTLTTDRYLVGWTTTNNATYWLSVIDGNGSFLAGPEEVSSLGIVWGNRDDSFRTRVDGTVSWMQGNANSATLHYFRFDGSGYLQ
ncbi:MAG: hypothetical protein HY868_01100 [Chloroflexi bacterium]|nr:hypothetical protein [Chloroflexota bacterium]